MVRKIESNKNLLFNLGIIIILISSLGNFYIQFLLIPISLYYIYKPEYIISILFVSSLHTGMFYFVPGVSLFVIIFCIYMISFILRKKKLQYKSLIAYLFFNIIVLTSAYNSITGNLSNYYTFLICTTMILLLYNEHLNTKILYDLLNQCSKYYVIYIVLLLGSTFAIGQKNIVGFNVNSISYATIICTIYNLGYNLLILKNNNIIFVIIGFISVIFMGSRGSMFAGIIIAAIIYLKSENKYKITILLLLLLALPFMGILLHEEVLSRFKISNLIEDKGSGRFTLWEIIITYIISNNKILFGIGYGGDNVREIVKEDFFGVSLDADCLYVDLLAQMGIIGLVLLFYFLARIIKFDKKNTLNNSLIFLSLLVGIGESMLDWNLFWFIIALAFVNKNAIKLNNKAILYNYNIS